MDGLARRNLYRSDCGGKRYRSYAPPATWGPGAAILARLPDPVEQAASRPPVPPEQQHYWKQLRRPPNGPSR